MRFSHSLRSSLASALSAVRAGAAVSHLDAHAQGVSPLRGDVLNGSRGFFLGSIYINYGLNGADCVGRLSAAAVSWGKRAQAAPLVGRGGFHSNLPDSALSLGPAACGSVFDQWHEPTGR